MIKKLQKFSVKWPFLIALTLVVLGIPLYFLYLQDYFEEQTLLNDLAERKETIETLHAESVKFSAEYATATAFTTSLEIYLQFNETATKEEEELKELKVFISIYADVLNNASVNSADEEAFIAEKENAFKEIKKTTELEYTLFSYLNNIDEQEYNVSLIDSSISSYDESAANQEVLAALYVEKLRLLNAILMNENELETFIKEHEDELLIYNFSTRMYISAYPENPSGGYNKWSTSLHPDSLSSWTESALSIINLEIIETNAKVKSLSTPLYNVEITPLYESEIMYGFLDQMSSFGDPPITFTIENKRDTPVNLILVAEIQGYTTEARKSVTIDAGESEDVELSFSTLSSAEVSEKKTTAIQYTVYSDGKIVIENALPVALYPKNVMIWNNNLTHGDMLIAGFVTPHAPEVKELLREAAEYAPGNTLSNLCNWCETSNDWRLTMQAEIKAIYSALKYRYDITYVNTPIAYGDAETAVYQTVYLPSESLIYKSANCMDGTVLFASALEAIGIDAYIFLVPGHAFVCYDLSPQDSYDYMEQCVETTMIGDSGFNDVIEVGNDNANRATYGYVVSVKEARELGILPIE